MTEKATEGRQQRREPRLWAEALGAILAFMALRSAVMSPLTSSLDGSEAREVTRCRWPCRRRRAPL